MKSSGDGKTHKGKGGSRTIPLFIYYLQFCNLYLKTGSLLKLHVSVFIRYNTNELYA
jgi:hypothetical protein